LYRGNDYFKKCYQPRTNIVKNQKGDLVIDTHSILVRWRKHFSQLLNIHAVNDARQTEIHTAETKLPQPSALLVDLVTEELKGPISPGTDQIPAELIKEGGIKIRY
jgi:hypothetical protein